MKYIQITAHINNANKMNALLILIQREFVVSNMSTTLCNQQIVYKFRKRGVETERILQLIENLNFVADVRSVKILP